LDDASPKIMGNLGELIENARKKYLSPAPHSPEEIKNGKEAFSPSDSKNSRNPGENKGSSSSIASSGGWQQVGSKGEMRVTKKPQDSWDAQRNSRVDVGRANSILAHGRNNFFGPPPKKGDLPTSSHLKDDSRGGKKLKSSRSSASSDEGGSSDDSGEQKGKNRKKGNRGSGRHSTPPPAAVVPIIKPTVATGRFSFDVPSKKEKLLAAEKIEAENALRRKIESDSIKNIAADMGLGTPPATAAPIATAASTLVVSPALGSSKALPSLLSSCILPENPVVGPPVNTPPLGDIAAKAPATVPIATPSPSLGKEVSGSYVGALPTSKGMPVNEDDEGSISDDQNSDKNQIALSAKAKKKRKKRINKINREKIAKMEAAAAKKEATTTITPKAQGSPSKKRSAETMKQK
jgi:hypothetical protein